MVLFHPQNFYTVDDCNMNKLLENSWHLVFYQGQESRAEADGDEEVNRKWRKVRKGKWEAVV